MNRRSDRLRQEIADIVRTRIAARKRLWTILILVLILALIGGWATWPYWGDAGAVLGRFLPASAR